MVFQSYNLFPHLTVEENVMLSPRIVKKVPTEKARETGGPGIEAGGPGPQA